MALADTANLIVSLSLDDRFSGPLNRAQGTLSRFGGGMAQSAKGVGQLAVGLGRVGVVAAGAAAGGLITVTKLAGNFEAQLNTINTIAKLNEQDLRGVGEGIRDTFRATGQPLNDLTNAYYDLLSAGVKVKDAQAELNTAVRLGIGGLGTTSEAVDLLTTAQNAYGLTAKQTAAASDIFAQAVNDGKVRISEISATFANVAPTAKQFGVSIDEIGAAYGFLTAKGVPAAEVTTQMNRAILDLVKPSADAKKVLEDMGTTGEQLIKKDGLVGALQALRDRADELGVPFQKLFGRIEGFKFALQTTGPAQAGFNRELERMHDSAGQVTAQFEERQKGLNYQLGRLKALAQDAGITIGTALLPKIVPLLERLNTFIQDNQDKIQKFGEDLADGFGKFADRVSETDFSNFVNGLKTVASVGGKVVELFLRLPSGVQALIVGGAAINRISGGLVGAGVGNIVGGGIKLLFERGGPGNPMFVTVTNPGFGAGGPGGTAGGTGAAGTLGRVAGIAFAAIAAEQLGEFLGHTFFFDPTVKPAVKFEQSQFDKLIASGDPDKIQRGLDGIAGGINDIKRLGPVLEFLSRDQVAILEEQLRVGNAAKTEAEKTREAAFANNRTEEQLLVEAKGQRLAAASTTDAILTLEQRLIHDKDFKPKLDTSEFLRILRRTSEFGRAGEGTTIEQGPKTGRDRLGDAFVALVRRVPKNLLTGEVYREVSNHVIALEEVQRDLIRDGKIEAARHAQRNIERLSHLIGKVDQTIPHFRRLEDKAERQVRETANTKAATDRGFARANAALGIVARKDFSPSFSATINTNVTAYLSTYQAISQIARSSAITVNGSHGSVPLIA